MIKNKKIGEWILMKKSKIISSLLAFILVYTTTFSLNINKVSAATSPDIYT